MNLTLQDWASLVALISIAGGAITALVKLWIINPLSTQIKDLNGNFNALNLTLDRIRVEHKELENRVDKHDVELVKHDEQLRTLFNKVL